MRTFHYCIILLILSLSCTTKDPMPRQTDMEVDPILKELLVIGFAGHRVSDLGEEDVSIEFFLGSEKVASGITDEDGFFAIPINNELLASELRMVVSPGRTFWDIDIIREGFIPQTDRVNCRLDTNVFFINMLPEASLDFGLLLGADTSGYDFGAVSTFSDPQSIQLQFNPQYADTLRKEFRVFGNISDTIYLHFYDSNQSLETPVRVLKYPVLVDAFSLGKLEVKL